MSGLMDSGNGYNEIDEHLIVVSGTKINHDVFISVDRIKRISFIRKVNLKLYTCRRT